MIHVQTGDFWNTPANIRVNTINCAGVMGKGIAKEFKARYPEMFKAYCEACSRRAILPGDIFVHQHGDGTQVWNAATKDHWHDPSEYDWIDKIVLTMRLKLVLQPPNLVVNCPALGCANGGLCYTAVLDMIARRLGNLPHRINVFNPPGCNLHIEIQ
jgi:hypothetical protein